MTNWELFELQHDMLSRLINQYCKHAKNALAMGNEKAWERYCDAVEPLLEESRGYSTWFRCHYWGFSKDVEDFAFEAHLATKKLKV